jgi:hypothetical protein
MDSVTLFKIGTYSFLLSPIVAVSIMAITSKVSDSAKDNKAIDRTIMYGAIATTLSVFLPLATMISSTYV